MCPLQKSLEGSNDSLQQKDQTTSVHLSPRALSRQGFANSSWPLGKVGVVTLKSEVSKQGSDGELNCPKSYNYLETKMDFKFQLSDSKLHSSRTPCVRREVDRLDLWGVSTPPSE